MRRRFAYSVPSLLLFDCLERTIASSSPLQACTCVRITFHLKPPPLDQTPRVASPPLQVMLMDADIILFLSPPLLFSSPSYERYGHLLFRDQRTTTRNNRPDGTKMARLRALLLKMWAGLQAGADPVGSIGGTKQVTTRTRLLRRSQGLLQHGASYGSNSPFDTLNTDAHNKTTKYPDVPQMLSQYALVRRNRRGSCCSTDPR